jgi:hypothetical protein
MTDYNYYKKNSDPAINTAKATIAKQTAERQQAVAKAQPAQVKVQPVAVNTSQPEIAQVKPRIPATTLSIANSRMQQAPELAKVKDVKTIKVEVLDVTPIELEIEAKSLAI